MDKLLLCTDGSEFALKAADKALELATGYRLQVVVLNVVDPSGTGQLSPAMLELGEDPAVRELTPEQADNIETTIDRLRSAGVEHTLLRDYGHPAGRIIKIAEQENVDMIVVGSRGLSKWKALVLGSVSHGVLYHAHCSVLVVR